MIDGYKDSNYIEIMKEICPELETSKPGELNSKRLPILKTLLPVIVNKMVALHGMKLLGQVRKFL